jgi:hypothetical protein
MNAEQEQECFGCLDTAIDFLLKVFPFGDILPVDPDIQFVFFQGFDEPFGEVDVLAGIRYEDV